ncbi:Rossmann-like and DUF2520 domain-containing protein [Pedobacter alpinus]|uniref:Rossmann-like and DUF2520 domain-containing protein n=1 Tax=Pedobacter alpinus TaxID=1590643 RepID=A0ABW5TUT0_9SPHI
MRIAMLGAGNVATHLSKALINAGFPVAQVWSRNIENAVDLASQIGANSIAKIEEVSTDIDIVILAVADDAIAEISNRLPINADRVVLHTSGSTAIDTLNKHQKFGVLYPLQTFSKNTDLDFSQIPLCIEANDDDTLNQLNLIANRLSNNVVFVNSDSRMRLHIAAVFACNFSNYFFGIAQDLMSGAQLNFDLIRPLIQETASKAMEKKPVDVQTGPAKRNDQNTIKKHLELLESEPTLKELYALLSQNIVKKYSES